MYKKENTLIIIENGLLTSYVLDNKTSWEVGRPSKENEPDIKLYSSTISRKHGMFQNMDGFWFYVDYYGKNGTVYNGRHLDPGVNGETDPIMLEDGDRFVFGGGKTACFNAKTVFGLFLEYDCGSDWRIMDVQRYDRLVFTMDAEELALEKPKKGTVVKREQGIAICMGNLIYLQGDIRLKTQ